MIHYNLNHKGFSSRYASLLFPALLICILSIMAGGCRKEYINGDLDGQWRLEEVAVDGVSQPLQEAMYWNFSFHVVQLSRYGGPITNGNLSFDGSQLTVDFPLMIAEESRPVLRRWGVYANPATYHIESLTSSRLVMSSGNVTLRMHKY